MGGLHGGYQLPTIFATSSLAFRVGDWSRREQDLGVAIAGSLAHVEDVPLLDDLPLPQHDDPIAEIAHD